MRIAAAAGGVLVATAIALGVASAVACQTTGGILPRRQDSAHAQRIDSTVRAVLAARNIPGATIGVLFRDTVLHIGAYGMSDLARRIPASPATVFQIGSLTKPMTALAVLLLADQGRLGLDDAASRYVPALPARYSDITIRQLLTHTSGISPDMRTANVDEMPLEEFWTRLSERPSAFPPGANVQYANAGYAILSFAVERVSGMDFGAFLQRRVFAPLGMRSSGYRVARTSDTRHAVGYDLVEGHNQEQPHVFSGWGNSGVETTIEDLARFAAAIDRRELLSARSWDLVFSPGLLATGVPASFTFGEARASYGMGWFLTTSRGRPLHTHGGAIAGFSSILNRYPDERYTVIVLSNGKQGEDRLGQADAIARAVDQVRESGRAGRP